MWRVPVKLRGRGFDQKDRKEQQDPHGDRFSTKKCRRTNTPPSGDSAASDELIAVQAQGEPLSPSEDMLLCYPSVQRRSPRRTDRRGEFGALML